MSEQVISQLLERHVELLHAGLDDQAREMATVSAGLLAFQGHPVSDLMRLATQFKRALSPVRPRRAFRDRLLDELVTEAAGRADAREPRTYHIVTLRLPRFGWSRPHLPRRGLGRPDVARLVAPLRGRRLRVRRGRVLTALSATAAVAGALVRKWCRRRRRTEHASPQRA
jgi:hypothetical protein